MRQNRQKPLLCAKLENFFDAQGTTLFISGIHFAQKCFPMDLAKVNAKCENVTDTPHLKNIHDGISLFFQIVRPLFVFPKSCWLLKIAIHSKASLARHCFCWQILKKHHLLQKILLASARLLSTRPHKNRMLYLQREKITLSKN